MWISSKSASQFPTPKDKILVDIIHPYPTEQAVIWVIFDEEEKLLYLLKNNKVPLRGISSDTQEKGLRLQKCKDRRIGASIVKLPFLSKSMDLSNARLSIFFTLWVLLPDSTGDTFSTIKFRVIL